MYVYINLSMIITSDDVMMDAINIIILLFLYAHNNWLWFTMFVLIMNINKTY